MQLLACFSECKKARQEFFVKGELARAFYPLRKRIVVLAFEQKNSFTGARK
ncbi:hypothetical protein U1329_03630 [Enterococcus cecorum]|nr:hypothetical protein [Enterococcus cecorum]